MEQAKKIAEEAMSLPTGKEVDRFARRKLKSIVPDLAVEVD